MKTSNYSPYLLSSALAFLLAAGAAHAQQDYLSEEDIYGEEIANGENISDPLEPVNRVTFKVNDFIYTEVMDPIASVYTTVTPEPVQESAGNFFDNLAYPVRLAGNLLQARWNGAWVETGRFAINTTAGIGGLFRPADRIEGFEPIPSEDIGQAFGAWGIGTGPYLVLPLLGPSNVRDLGGYVADRAVQPHKEPFSLIDDWNWEWRTALTATEVVVESPGFLDRYRRMKEGAIDPYGSLKNGYIQFREAAIEE
ncbi:MAG: VacJ family lipoprotein [Verrucomicrobiota bacterium]